MTREDVKTIFSNIAELAMFADEFTDRLEEALGCVVEEGQREDHVGELFLQIVCGEKHICDSFTSLSFCRFLH
jgi:dynamin-binding protein